MAPCTRLRLKSGSIGSWTLKLEKMRSSQDESGCLDPRMLRRGGELMAELQDRWLSVDEIRQHLGVSSDTVYRWIDRSAMPAHKMGRKWKFKREQVDAWIEAGGAAVDEARDGGPKGRDR